MFQTCWSLEMVQRITYRRRLSYNTKSNKRKVVRTPGGKLTFQVRNGFILLLLPIPSTFYWFLSYYFLTAALLNAAYLIAAAALRILLRPHMTIPSPEIKATFPPRLCCFPICLLNLCFPWCLMHLFMSLVSLLLPSMYLLSLLLLMHLLSLLLPTMSRIFAAAPKVTFYLCFSLTPLHIAAASLNVSA